MNKCYVCPRVLLSGFFVFCFIHGDLGMFDSVQDVLEAISRGEIVVVTDDEKRENEGDLVMAAEKVTDETINFMAKHGRGLICVAMTHERLDKLVNKLQVEVATWRRRFKRVCEKAGLDPDEQITGPLGKLGE